MDEVLSVKELGIRSLPPGSPSHLEHILDELNHSLDLDAPGTSLRILKKAFAFMTAYFADLVEGVASSVGRIKFEAPRPDDTAAALETLRTGLEFLRRKASHELPEGKALVDCFYQGTTERKFARLLEIGGKLPGGTASLGTFVTAQVSTRKKSVQEVRLYIPYLREWLESSVTLFKNAAIISERTSLGGRQIINVRLGRQTLLAGKRVGVSGCRVCIPQKEIDVPYSLYERPVFFFVPQKAPKFLTEILDRLDLAMKTASAVAGCLELRNALEFLIRYFAAVASKVCEEFGSLPKGAEIYIDASQAISASEKLLSLSLDSLKRMPDSPAANAVVGVFYRRNELFEFVPRWHTEILALNGQLSGWCQLEPGQGELEDPELCKVEFEKHVPTLREWLLSFGGYLQSTEHFFKAPKGEGFVEFSLRIGSRFIEIAEPGYVLWLNNPRPEGEMVDVESGGAAKPLIRESIDIPAGCPTVLSRILTRMDIYLRLGDPIESCVSLRDALDYLTRYFAGVAVMAFRQLGSLPPEAERLAQQSLSVHDCEKLLILALRSIGRESQKNLGIAVRSVFYYADDFSQSERPTGAHARLLALDATPSSKMQNLAEFCSLKAGEGVLSHPIRSKRELERFLPTLQDWLAMAAPFFKDCKHHEEPAKEDGRAELLIEYFETYLELVEPDYRFYVRPGADVVPDIEAPELPPPDLPFEKDGVDVPVRRKSPEEAAREQPFLVHRVDLIGDRPNSKGKTCASGYIVLSNAGGGTLSGTVGTTDDCIEVDPPRFRGNKVQLSYWVDTDQLPTSHEVFILLNTAHEERSISVYEMIGQANARRVSAQVGFFTLLLPNLLWLGFLVLAVHGASWYMHRELTELLGRGYPSLRLIQDAPEAYSEVVVVTQLLGYLFLWVAGIVPALINSVCRWLPPSTQELLEKQRKFLMVIPTVFVGMAMFTPVLSNHFTSSPDFPAMDLQGLFLYFMGLNVLSTYYQEMSLSGKLDDIFFNPVHRKVVTAVAWFVFLTTILLGVTS